MSPEECRGWIDDTRAKLNQLDPKGLAAATQAVPDYEKMLMRINGDLYQIEEETTGQGD